MSAYPVAKTVRCVLLRAALTGCCALWSLNAAAVDSDFNVEVDAAPLNCLTSIQPSIKGPAYPSDQLAGTSAVVRVHLGFSSKDAAPQVQIRFNNGTPAFAESVRLFVQNYRVPCLPPGRRFDGVQEFQFVIKPSAAPQILQGVPQTATRWADLPAECLEGIRKAEPPRFPSTGITGAEPISPGVVLARMVFRHGDQPPEVEIVYDAGQRRLANAVRASAQAYRLPCMKPGDSPLVAQRTFSFQWDGEEVPRLLPNLDLVAFLGAVKNIERHRVRFDFTTMGCPFKVAFAPYQPVALNAVSEVASKSPDRREFLNWLENISLDLPPRLLKTALGGETTVSVPCTVLDLS